jgi:hypothetical protein
LVANHEQAFDFVQVGVPACITSAGTLASTLHKILQDAGIQQSNLSFAEFVNIAKNFVLQAAVDALDDFRKLVNAYMGRKTYTRPAGGP